LTVSARPIPSDTEGTTMTPTQASTI